MKPEFNLYDELNKNKWPLLGMCLAIFILTLVLFSGGKKAERVRALEDEAGLSEECAKDTILLDTSEQYFESDSFSLTGPARLFTRGAGSNLTRVEHKEYELDESRLDPRAFPAKDGFKKGSSASSGGGKK